MATRSETSRRAILEATSALLAETTVQKLSIEAIAKRARSARRRSTGGGRARRRSSSTPSSSTTWPYPASATGPGARGAPAHLTSLVTHYAGPRGKLVAQLIAEGSTTSRRCTSSVSASGTGAGRRRARSSSAASARGPYAATSTRASWSNSCTRPSTCACCSATAAHRSFAEQIVATAMAGIGTGAAVTG